MQPVHRQSSLPNHTLAIILAGGRGSRLKDLGAAQAKPAVPFGGSYRLIDFPLSNCVNSGIRRIGVATQYRAQGLIRHLQDGWGLLARGLGDFVDVWPAEQQGDGPGWYQGTADAVYQNLEAILAHRPEHVLILAGDHIYKQDYGRLIADHVARGADATVSCVRVPLSAARDFGVVGTCEGGAISRFVEKPAVPPAIPGDPGHAFASMGIYVFRTAFLADLLAADHHNEKSSHDFGHDILPALVGRARLYAHRFEDSAVGTPYWRDVGTLDAYWQANIDLTAPTPPIDLYDPHWPIRTAMAPRAGARFAVGGSDMGLVAHTVAAGGVTVAGATVTDSLLSTDVSIGALSKIRQSVLLPGVKAGIGVRLDRTIVAEGCRLPDGLVVGQDPMEDGRWFTRTSGGVTLVSQHGLDQRAISRKLGAGRPFSMPPAEMMNRDDTPIATVQPPTRPSAAFPNPF